jgi:hypothetical protein
MNDLLIKAALAEEMKETVRQTRLNLELKEILDAHTEFIARYCEENRIPLPDMETTMNFMQKEKTVVDNMARRIASDETLQPQNRENPMKTCQNPSLGSVKSLPESVQFLTCKDSSDSNQFKKESSPDDTAAHPLGS